MEGKRGLFFPIVLLLNVAAVLVGLWFYSAQLASSSPLLWIFIPDCPLYVLLCIFLLIGKIKGDFFALIISANTLKYGLWTMLVLFFYPNYYFAPQQILMYCAFMLGHAGMAMQGFLLLPKKAGAFAIFFLLAWFLLNDFADYALGVHPPIPTEHMGAISLFALLLSFSIALAMPLLLRIAHSKRAQMLRSLLF